MLVAPGIFRISGAKLFSENLAHVDLRYQISPEAEEELKNAENCEYKIHT